MAQHSEELKEWLGGVSSDTGVDVSEYLPALVEHGLTKFLLNDIPSEDWAEIIKPVGPRIVIRKAAGNVYLNAELKNLKEFSQRLRAERDETVTAGADLRAELQKSQDELQRIDADLDKTEGDLSSSKSTAEAAEAEIAKLQAELEQLNAESEKLSSDIAEANAAKDKAVKDKEEAINRAIQLGVAGQNGAKAPAGYGFQGQMAAPAAAAAPAPAQQMMQQPGMMGGMMPPTSMAPMSGMMQQPGMMGGMGGAMPSMPQLAPPGAKVKPLEAFGWYHGPIGRPEAEGLLLGGACGPGSFLVRLSSRGGGTAYSLSARESMAPRVKHFKIESVGPQWKLGLKQADGQMFPTIPQLISYYKSLGDFSGVRLAKGAPKAGMMQPGMMQPGMMQPGFQ